MRYEQAAAIVDARNWGGDIETDARAKASRDAAIACVLDAMEEVERENRTLRDRLRPFALKATKWEGNHPRRSGFWPVSSTVTHRLGDFRAARHVLRELGEDGI